MIVTSDMIGLDDTNGTYRNSVVVLFVTQG